MTNFRKKHKVHKHLSADVPDREIKNVKRCERCGTTAYRFTFGVCDHCYITEWSDMKKIAFREQPVRRREAT
jgi:ribosomal protein L37E